MSDRMLVIWGIFSFLGEAVLNGYYETDFP